MNILVFVFTLFFGISKGIKDSIQFHWGKSKWHTSLNPKWWNPAESWQNKWKEGTPASGEKFLGSSTIFVFLTDAWHLFDALQRYAFIGVVCIAFDLNIINTIIAYIIFKITFFIIYK